MNLSTAVIDAVPDVQASEVQDTPQMSERRRPRHFRHAAAGIGSIVGGIFNFASLVVCLAVLAAIPIVQLIAFGYLLDVAGRLAAGGKLREALPLSRAAGRVGVVAIAVMMASLPVQLLVHWESVAALISPDSWQAVLLRGAALAAACLGMIYVMWAVARGGHLWHFLWPEPMRAIAEVWRPSTYATLPDQLWDFTASLELGRYFLLGLRGTIGTLIWLTPGFVIISANRNGEEAAGLVMSLAIFALAVVMLYLPMLQTRFAAENRFRALFEVRKVRRLFRYAPWSWFLAMFFGLLLPIPLYLLKIEATPKEVVWLPTLICVAFILPARIIEGMAYRRSKRIADRHYEGGAFKPKGLWNFVSRWVARVLIGAVVAIYIAFLTASQYTSWDGLQTWVQQHAVLIPIPFLSGV